MRLARRAGIKPASDNEMAHSQEELRLILAHSEKAGILSEENREIIEGVFQFSKRIPTACCIHIFKCFKAEFGRAFDCLSSALAKRIGAIRGWANEE